MLSLKQLRKALLYCTIFNYLLLILWFVILQTPHAWIYQLSGIKLGVSIQDFDRWNLIGLMFYKVAIILFNLIPYIALYLVRERESA